VENGINLSDEEEEEKIIYMKREMIGRMKLINQSKYNPHNESRKREKKSNILCFEYKISTNIICD
jgi:hypothetical protein